MRGKTVGHLCFLEQLETAGIFPSPLNRIASREALAPSYVSGKLHNGTPPAPGLSSLLSGLGKNSTPGCPWPFADSLHFLFSVGLRNGHGRQRGDPATASLDWMMLWQPSLGIPHLPLSLVSAVSCWEPDQPLLWGLGGLLAELATIPHCGITE